jgi:hypothetical protein
MRGVIWISIKQKKENNVLRSLVLCKNQVECFILQLLIIRILGGNRKIK